MEANHVAIRIDNQDDMAIFTDGKFVLEHRTSGLIGPLCLDGAILAGEIDKWAVAAGGAPFLLDQSAHGAGTIVEHGKTPHFHALASKRRQ